MLTIHINATTVKPHVDHLYIFTDHRPELIALQLMLFFFKKERYEEDLVFEINDKHSLPEAHAVVRLFYDMRLMTGSSYPGTFEQLQQAGFYKNVSYPYYEQIKRHVAEVYLPE